MMIKLKVVPTDASDALFKQLFELADTNKDGLISFEEFVRLFQSDPRGMSQCK